MPTDTPKMENESEDEAETKSVGMRKFTDNRSEKTPLDGTGGIQNLPEGEPVKLKCPYCDFTIDVDEPNAERNVRHHITQTQSGRHKERNAFQEMMFIHGIDEDDVIVENVRNRGMEWDSKQNSEQGEETTTVLPDDVDPSTRKGEILSVALKNPSLTIPEISEKVYGDRDNSYPHAVLEEHLSEEQYEKRKTPHDKHMKKAREAALKAKRGEYEKPKTRPTDDITDKQKRAIEAGIRFPNVKNSIIAVIADVSTATVSMAFRNHGKAMDEVEEKRDSGEIENPPYLIELPYDETPLVYTMCRLYGLTDQQRKLLEYNRRNKHIHDGNKTRAWVTDQCDAAESAIYYALKRFDGLPESMSEHIESGKVTGPPYYVNEDSKLVKPTSDETVTTMDDLRELIIEIQATATMETDTPTNEAEPADEPETPTEPMGEPKSEPEQVHPDVAGKQTVITTSQPDSSQDTLTVDKERVKQFAHEIDALQRRNEFDLENFETEGSLREQYVLEIAERFLRDIKSDND